MREIRFRAWDEKDCEYIYSVRLKGNYRLSHLFSFVEDIPDRYIVEQFTGRTDKNGKDIYEGDIISADISSYSRTVPTMGEIVYDSFFGFFANKNYGGSTGLFKLANIEVIGNIHNDKNLLDNIS